jgi:ribosome modulation factor
MAKPGLWSCRKAEVNALAHPEKIVKVKEPTLKHLRSSKLELAEKWAHQEGNKVGWVLVQNDLVRAWLAGWKACKRDKLSTPEKQSFSRGYKAGKKDAVIDWVDGYHTAYNALVKGKKRVSDSRRELNASSQVTETRAPACPKKEERK